MRTFSRAHAETLQAGMAAPDFVLSDASGKSHQLADWRGQWLVLYFYPKDDTPGCTTEAKGFRDTESNFKAIKAKVVGISLDNATSHQEFAGKYQLPFTLLSDPGGEVAQRSGALMNLGIMKFAKRHTFLIDPEGRIAKTYRDVEPSSHAQELLNDIRMFSKQP